MMERFKNRQLLVGLGLVVVLSGTSIAIGPRAWSHLNRPPADDRLEDLNLLAAATPLPAPARSQPVTVMVGTAGHTAGATPTAAPTRNSLAAATGRRTAPVRRGPIAEVLPLTGRVVAQDESPVVASSPGRLVSVHVKPGQEVTAGDVLASLDVQQLERDLVAARARVDDATTRVQAAEAQVEAQHRQAEQRQAADRVQREGGLAQADASLAHALAGLQQLRSAVSPEQGGAVDSAIADVTQSRAALAGAAATIRSAPAASDPSPVDVNRPQHALEQAQAELSDLEAQLAASHVRASFAGTVTSIGAHPGDLVQKGQTLILLAKPGESLIQLNLTDEDAARLAVGQRGTVTLEDRDETASEASIVTITPARSGKSAFAQLKVTWSNTPPGYGKTVDVAITVEAKADALIIPSKAVHTLGTRHLVDYLDGSARHSVPVQVGIIGGQETEILQGLTEGQVVQVGP